MTVRPEAKPGQRLWREVGEVANPASDDEFPEFRDAEPETDRREFLRIMAASLALAGAAGCSPERSKDALPYVVQPEEVVPGRPSYYASGVTLGGYVQPVLAAMHRGRPTKLEGNPQHPAVLGRTDLFTQAAILDLYDPDRSPTPLRRGRYATWAEFDRLLFDLRGEWRRNGGEGLSLLLDGTTSPTLLRQLAELQAAYPKARIHAFEPIEEDRHEAARLVFGRPLATLPRLDRARVVVSLDDDLLGPGPFQVWNVRHWATGRGGTGAEGRLRLHVAEPTPSQTGAVADARLIAPASRIPALAAAIAARLGLPAAMADGEFSDAERAWVDSSAEALRREAGRSLLTVGPRAPAAAQALAFAANEALGNVGRTIEHHDPFALAPEGPVGSLPDLARELAAGRVSTLVVLGPNPAYAAPADLGFPELMKRAALTIHAGLHTDETAAASEWHLPLPHPLETWSDGRAVDGTASILQPLIEPLYSSRSPHELLAGLLDDAGTGAYEIVRATWRERFGPGLEAAWKRALHDGFVERSAARPVTARARGPDRPPPAPSAPAGAGALEIVFRPDPTIWDGRFANNAWLQELGKPLTRTTWENVVGVSPALARERGLSPGDRVRVEQDGRAVEGPAWIMPGQAERAVTLFLGYGRRKAGRVGTGIGYDAYRLRTTKAPWHAAGALLTRLGEGPPLASTQPHQRMEGEDFVRVVGAGNEDASRPEDREQSSLYPEWPRGDTAWAMAIDLDLCSGCNACTIACQAENNVPVVGRDEVVRGRHMHWLRVDHYHAGEPDDPKTCFQPVPCMHCEQAPCEMGCPVHATVHGTDGLNQQIYNRCIGTRTCSSYCPYKVRRFNWYDYTSDKPEGIKAQRNPDVTVRGRGVMEKCTYCVQRIRAAHAEADKENRPIRDGEVETACQAACPARAITFGNMADPDSRVAKARSSPRNYALLAHLGTRPRTTYLARIEAAVDGSEAP